MLDQENRTFVMERVHLEWQINVYYCDNNFEIIDSAIDVYESGYGPAPEKRLIEGLYGKCKNAGLPVIYMEEDMVYYMAFTDEEQKLYAMGPVATENLSFAQHHAFRHRHGILEQKYRIPYMAPAKVLSCLSIVYYMFTGGRVTEQTLIQENEAAKKIQEAELAIYQLRQDSEENRRLSYRNEQRWLNQIETGTLDRQQVRLDKENLQKLERVGQLALNNSLKQYEYMAISQICLASRAAMRGGMNTFEAYTLSDMYYQKVSQCSDVMEILDICLKVEIDFSEQVRLARQQSKKKAYIEQCKDYIARHRTTKFTIGKMAEDLGLNRSYLSRLFSQQMGMTIQEYTLRTRLEAAANILRFSEEQIGTIAEYLCFASQSYFTERFHKQYGLTPNDYRSRYKVIDFAEGL